MTEPHSIEAEQQLLGNLLMRPARIAEVAGRGGAALFYDPVHAQIYKVMAERDRAGDLVDAITIARAPSLAEGLADLGGPGYIARLAGAAIGASAMGGYVDHLDDLRAKREILALIRKTEAAVTSEDGAAGDAASALEAGLMAIGATSSAVRPVSMMAAATEALRKINDAYHGREVECVRSGIGALDYIIPGMEAGELALLGGRPSMGKTAVAMTMGLNAARAGHGVIFASLEMTPESLAVRAMAEGTGGKHDAVSYSDARRGQMTELQYRSLVETSKRLAELPIQFLPRKYAEASALLSGVKQCVRHLPKDKLPLLIIDYLQLMDVKGSSRFEKITEISRSLKDLAMRLELPVLALSQLSRAVEQREDKRPQLS
ncbi:replicative DNA helicase, partial [Palleronia sp.]|uniref:replicative DNA helicase n=1 Tax=Palleronia sp. TaxID=1940284 RepID=UPI0035C85202